jgi:gliding motility-associated-like protein
MQPLVHTSCRIVALILTLALTDFLAYGQPSASFTVDNAVVCQGGMMTATSTTTGITGQAAYAWSVSCTGWVIGNQGAASTSFNVAGANSCTITLDVTDASGSSTATQTVQVLARPTAIFTSNVQNVCQGGCVNFMDQSTTDQSGGANSVSSWQWIFDGGDPSGNNTSPTPSSCYDFLGDFDVYLGVIDNFGCSSSNPAQGGYIHVTEAIPLSPSFTSACTPPLSGTFAANAIGPWTWTFPPGTSPASSTVENPTVTFGSAGTHDVTLTAGGSGCESTVTFPVSVSATPTVSFDLPQNACVGSVDVENVSDAVAWNWTVDAPATIAAPNAQFSTINFPQSGQYTVTLDADLQGGCSGTINHTITIGDQLSVDFFADTLEGCTAPFPVNFTPDITGTATTYSWNFGMGSPSTSNTQNPGTVNFPYGCSTVSLTAGNGGCSVTETKPGYICVQEPEVGIYAPWLYNYCLPLSVPFSDTTNHQVPVVSWDWNFGDGTIVTSQNPNPPPHIYTTAGTFWASLTITNAIGCTATSNQIMVRVDDLPTPNFEVSDTLVCPGETVCFTNLSTDTIANPLWYWNFNDNNWFGGGSYARDPCYAFVDSGYHDICLTVDNNGCENTMCLEDLIRVHPPELNFSVTRSCENTTEVAVQILSNSTDTFQHVESDYYWNFNDGSPYVVGESSYTHEYIPPGFHQICLYASNDSLGCNNSTCAEVELYNPIPIINPSETVTCPDTIFFTDYPTYGVDLMGWDFGDGSPIEWMDPWMAQWFGVSHYYETPGYYDVTLILEISGIDSCYDTLVVADLIQILGVGQSADFSYVPTSVCDNQNFCFQFTDQSPTGEVSSWSWDFGDLTASNDTNPAHCYQNWTGEDTVTLTIVDLDGCSSDIALLVEEPPALETDIVVSASVACQGDSVQFMAMPSDPSQVQSYMWSFGDGTTSLYQNPFHAYAVNDTFDVHVVTTSITNCVDTTFLPGAVIVDDPVADFSAEVDFTFCPQVFVEFTNHSLGGLNTYELYYGDGLFDLNAFYPTATETKMYNPFGVYDAVLVATNPAGCTDSDTLFNVLDPFAALGPFSISDMDTANCPPFDIELTAFNVQDSCYTYNWDFGNGNPVLGNAGTVVQHTYTEAGTYWIKLVMTNCINFQCVYEDSMEITVGEMLVNAWSDTTICYGDSVQLHASASVANADSAGYRYLWNHATFLSEDSTASPFAFPTSSQVFVVTGTYSDCIALDSVIVNVDQLTPILHDPVAAVCDNDPVLQVTGANLPVTYFGDHISQTGIFDPVAALPGCDTIFYSHIDANGCTNVDTMCITVHPLPDVNFVPFDSLCNNASSLLLSNATPVGGFYSGTGVSNGFFHPDSVNAGIHAITYTLTDQNGCISAPTQDITVNPVPDIDFIVSDVCFGDSVQINNGSTISSGQIVSSIWSYDGVLGDTIFNPQPWLFPDTGQHDIQLVSASDHGCFDTLRQTVVIHPVPKAEFDFQSVCLTFPTQFTDQSVVGSGNITAWQWEFSNGSTGSNLQNPSHVFNAAGTHTVFLGVTTDFGCTDTVSHQVTVHPLPVLEIEHEDVCFGFQVPFTGEQSIASGNVVSTLWEFGDGATSVLGNPSHLYATPGFYDVQFSAMSDRGCSDSIQQTVEIFELPVAGFSSFPTNEGCAPLELTLVDTSSIPYPYYIQNWQWTISDGKFSEITQPTFNFDEPDTIDVKLLVWSNKGCADSTLSTGYIIVHPVPIAGFDFSPEEPTVFFPTVGFTDQSIDATVWEWDFGDFETSELPNPEHSFPDTGLYVVRQVVFNAFNCSDTAYAPLKVIPEPTLYIPNTFTPNQDGINETFTPKGYGIADFTMTIFDRWGEELYFTSNMDVPWDGTYRGAEVEQGVYVYLITTVSILGKYEQYTGHVNLVR